MKQKRRRAWVALLGAAVLAWLLWPLQRDDSRMEADPVLLRGKQAYLAAPPQPATTPLPNIVVLLADDLGKYDINLYGQGAVDTPNINALARRGATFTAGYVTAPVCSPSRCGLLTGRYQQRFGDEMQFGDIYPNTRAELLLSRLFLYPTQLRVLPQAVYPTTASLRAQGLRQSETTFGDLAKRRGYATGVIGKWHVGYAPGLLPSARGFDYHFGFYSPATTYVPQETEDIASYPHREPTDIFLRLHGRRGPAQLFRNGEVVQEPEYLTEKITDEAEAFIDRNKAHPFLLYVPFNAPHEPYQVPKHYLDQFAAEQDVNKRIYFGMIAALDEGVGRIVAKLKSAGLEDNTLIMFSSDNGGAVYAGATTNAPLKGGKLSHHEGGVNVPFSLTWPGHVPAGTLYGSPVSTLDVFTTIAAALELPLPADRPYDGVDLVERVSKNTPAHEALFWREGASKAVRAGEWKLIVNARQNRNWLYNLSADPSESHDLSAAEPARVLDLQKRLQAWESEMPPQLWPPVAYAQWSFPDGWYTFDI